MPRRSRASLAALWVVVASAGGCAHSPEAGELRPDYVGALRLPAVGPQEYAPDSLYDHPVVATFFATWCFPCLGQLPVFSELAHDYASQGLKVVAVGMDLEGAKVLGPFAYQSEFPFPVLVANEPLRKGETPFGAVTVLPSTVILSRTGEVVAAWPGLAEPKDIRAAVEKALK